MPWLETAPVDERIRFIQDALSDRFTMSELCARYGVSRRVGYKWLARYEAEGRHGLHDRSRAPHHCPHRIDTEIAELICGLRRRYPFKGRAQAAAHPRHAPSPRAGVACPEHRGGLARAPRPRPTAAPPPAASASRGRAAHDGRPERSLDR